jgi:hypothetical protein
VRRLKVNPVTILLIIAFVYPIVKGLIVEFSSNSLKSDINDIEGDIGFILSMISGFYFTRKVFIQHETEIYEYIYNLIPQNITSVIESSPVILYLILLPTFVFIIFNIIKGILYLINIIFFYPILDGIEEGMKHKSPLFKRLISGIFEIPRSICYVLLLTFILSILSVLNLSKGMEEYLSTSNTYNFLCKTVVIPITNSKVAKQLPNIINNSFKIEIVQNSSEPVESKPTRTRTIVYYNGVTLEDGIKSNDSIDSFAIKLTSKETDTKKKAKIIYEWIGSNIEYDNEKAASVLNNNFNIKSGAIPAFQDRKGICFDYACLYVAMCRAVGIKVRLVTGEGFNGVSWVGHAWNQVYIPSEGTWINVDTTFYKGGNYFNSKRFEFDHKSEKVVGEW